MPDGEALAGLSITDDAMQRRVFRKVAWRLVPFLCLLYVFNILDRVNVSFALLTMQDDLGLSDAVSDWGFGLFYVGYILFEIPSNLLLRRFGARRWIARIMITWGLVSCATMMVVGPGSFFLARILLGVAEAGFFPGIVLFLTYWFPARERARVMAFFMVAISVAGTVGNPLSGAILQYFDGTAGLRGWQWLFLLEGLPSVLLGITVLFVLTDRPEQAGWLAAPERAYLVERLRQEEQYRQERQHGDVLRALLHYRVWLLIAVYFSVALGTNASGGYFPRLIKASFEGASKFQVGLLSALPSACALVGMILYSVHSDRTGERRGHVAVAAFAAAVGWAVSAVSLPHSPWLVLAGFCLAQTAMMCMLPTFWTLPTSFLTGVAAAGGIALINSMGNVGGLLGAPVLGTLGPWALASVLGAGGVLALCVRHDATLDRPQRST
jgi:ACS family tartrate transporter-like MFS transporter